MGCVHSMADLPAWVSPKGMLNFSAKARSAPWASEYLTPPPQIRIGFFASRMRAAASATASAVGGRRSMTWTRFLKKLSG